MLRLVSLRFRLENLAQRAWAAGVVFSRDQVEALLIESEDGVLDSQAVMGSTRNGSRTCTLAWTPGKGDLPFGSLVCHFGEYGSRRFAAQILAEFIVVRAKRPQTSDQRDLLWQRMDDPSRPIGDAELRDLIAMADASTESPLASNSPVKFVNSKEAAV